MERDRRGHQQPLDERGQSTVEFAVIMMGFAALMAGLAALLHAFDGGMFVEHALGCASHHLAGASPALLGELFLY